MEVELDANVSRYYISKPGTYMKIFLGHLLKSPPPTLPALDVTPSCRFKKLQPCSFD